MNRTLKPRSIEINKEVIITKNFIHRTRITIERSTMKRKVTLTRTEPQQKLPTKTLRRRSRGKENNEDDRKRPSDKQKDSTTTTMTTTRRKNYYGDEKKKKKKKGLKQIHT